LKKTDRPLTGEEQTFFLEFYIAYRDFLHYMIRKYEPNPANQEDIMQDTLVRLIKNVSILQTLETGAAYRYLAHTVRTAYVDHVRKQGDAILIPLEECIGGEMPVQREDLWSGDLQLHLPPREWDVLEGKYLWGYSDRQLAKQLGTTPNNIRVILFRAKKRARALLERKQPTR